MTTRPPAGGLQTCRRCGADLADGAGFCAVCGTPVHGKVQPSRGDRRASAGRPWWIPAAIIVGGIAAIAGGALLAVALGGRDEVGGDPGAGASGSVVASALPSGSEAPSVEPHPSPSPTPAQAPLIANRSIVEVGDEPLNLRQQPNESASILAELPSGRRLFTIGDPTDAGELRWYRVGVVSNGCEEDCNLVGHVATPLAADEAPRLAEVTIDCPSSPMTAEALSGLDRFEALHCFGRNELEITGTVDTPCCSPPSPIVYTPAWLAPGRPALLLPNAGVSLVVEFHPHPDADLEVPERGDVVRVTGHFEDPAATSCRAEVDEDFFEGQPSPEPVQPPDPARVILECRATFVWTDYEVTGSGDLGPCCGRWRGPSFVASIGDW